KETAAALGLSILDVLESSSFIELGGNSMSAIALVNGCRRNGVILDLESVLTATSLTALLLSSTSRQTENKISRKKSKNGFKKAPFSIEQDSRDSSSGLRTLEQAPVPHMLLSFIQGGQRKPGCNIIHYYQTYDISHLSTIKRAWREVIESEPIFRTIFILHKDNGTLTQQEVAPFLWTEVVVDNTDTFEKEVGELHRTSNIETSLKVVIMKAELAPKSRFTLIWRVHHALMDGYSCNVVLNKLRRAMGGLPVKQGLSFVSLAQKLHAYREIHRSRGEQFWKEQRRQYGAGLGQISLPKSAAEVEDTAALPTDISFRVPQGELSYFSKRIGVTLASVYYAAWALVLSRYIGSDTVTCGAVFSCRNLPLEGITETLDRNQLSTDYVRCVFYRLVELSSFQWTVPEDGYTRDFSSVLGVQVEEPRNSKKEGFATLEQPSSRVMTDMPLNICAGPDDNVTFSFSEAYYSKENVEMMASMFQTALATLLQPSQIIQNCLQNLLTTEHRNRLFTVGNCTSELTTCSSVSEDLITLFERCASAFPTSIAIKMGSELMTYAELNDLASTISKYLVSIVNPGTVVCVHADRSINWIVAIYGILKARAVYCPLDRVLPPDLRTSYFETVGSRVFLTTAEDQHALLVGHAAAIISVEEIVRNSKDVQQHKRRKVNAKHDQGLREAAYLCFTSGSSGKPKGVICTHRGLVAFQRDLEVRLFAQPGRKIAQIMSPAFDGSIHEIFSALSYGATLVLGSASNPFGHLKLVDSAILTPSLAAMLNPSDYPLLETVYLVGEAVSQKVNDCWASTKQLYNMYGPTETTCGSTVKRLQPNLPVTIGAPNTSTRIYILDDCQELVPYGVIGEIYLAGVQVSLGYIENAQETSARFMLDSICEHTGERMYRTGDRGFWNNDGEIICIGRTDRQIKLQGFRLDLNDIEARMLKAVPSATVVFVTVKDDMLVAMLQPASLDLSLTRCFISKALPPYAVPQRLAAVDNIPITPAGKTDYNAVGAFKYATGLLEAPKPLTDNEKKIASAWRNILNLPVEETIAHNSNFLDLGGTSIHLLLMSHRLAAEFKRKVPLKLILGTNTLSELARAIENTKINPEGKGENEEWIFRGLEEHALSPMEYEWWTKYQQSGDTSCFNVTFACSLTETIDRWKLASAWNSILSRHRILRCRYVLSPQGEARKEYSQSPPRILRLRGIDMQKEINRPFMLHQQPPIRVFMSRDKLVVIASHIICDLSAMRILLREVGSAYQGTNSEPVQRKEYWETTRWTKQPSTENLGFWSQYLGELPALKNYSLGRLAFRKSSYQGSSRVCKVPQKTFEDVIKFTAKSKLSFHQLTLAAVSIALTYAENSQDIVLGAPYLNRASKEEMEVVGLFLQPLPIRISYSESRPAINSNKQLILAENPIIDPFLVAVRESSQAALSHDIQWHQLLKHLEIQPDHPDHPLFDVMVTFHEFDPSPMLPIPETTPLYTWTEGSKFKLMVEANAVTRDTLLLRFEHDEECFSGEDVEVFQKLLMLTLISLCRGERYADIKEQLRSFRRNAGDSRVDEIDNRIPFAAQLDSI
ncbi:Nonribosomal peptide synthetase, partial [Lachnellula willkommii]